MGFVGVLNALMMSVTERVREIGILSSLGWKPSRIVALVVSEGLVLAAVGSGVGAGLGLGALRALGASSRVGGLIEVRVAPLLIVEAVAAAIVMGAVGSLYPALYATRLSPVEALRHE
jgi:putative ABC transport system permease protein